MGGTKEIMKRIGLGGRGMYRAVKGKGVKEQGKGKEMCKRS